jgi:hypothetical protein
VKVEEEVLRSDDNEGAKEERGDDSVESRIDETEGSGVRERNVVG